MITSFSMKEQSFDDARESRGSQSSHYALVLVVGYAVRGTSVYKVTLLVVCFSVYIIQHNGEENG
jgi:hypothetical protein